MPPLHRWGIIRRRLKAMTGQEPQPSKEGCSSNSTTNTNIEGLAKSPKIVIPAQAGIYNCLKLLDSRIKFRNDKQRNPTFCEIVNIDELAKSPENVIPAQAGICNYLKILDSRLRGNDIRS